MFFLSAVGGKNIQDSLKQGDLEFVGIVKYAGHIGILSTRNACVRVCGCERKSVCIHVYY